MRRSAAPSFRADVKRARFLPHIIKNISLNDKENKGHSSSLVTISRATREIDDSTNVPFPVQDTADETKRTAENIRSNEDVLDLLFEADSTNVENTNNSSNILLSNEKSNTANSVRNFKTSLSLKPLKRNNSTAPSQSGTEESNTSLSNCIFCIKDVEEASLFNVVWCKRSGKKHKTWEGDGLLIVRSRSAVLKDLNGKTLDKGLGYKLKETESLEEGSKFFIGGKECEIQYKISDEDCRSSKYCKCNSSTESPVKQPEKPVVKIHKPC